MRPPEGNTENQLFQYFPTLEDHTEIKIMTQQNYTIK